MPFCSAGTFLYTVRPGDTLWKIARRFHTTINEIALLNPGIDFNNLYIGQKICIRPEYGFMPPSNQPVPIRFSKAEMDLNNYIRMLWEQHVAWTRLTILSMIFNLLDVNLTTNHLLQNPIRFKETLKSLYGEAVASKFVDLLKTHLSLAGQLVKAAINGDNDAASNAEKSWYENADEIAAFLGSINPYWSKKSWEVMLHKHLQLTKAEAIAILTKDYTKGISLFDEIEKEALEMADMMTYGIVNQFPDRFKR